MHILPLHRVLLTGQEVSASGGQQVSESEGLEVSESVGFEVSESGGQEVSESESQGVSESVGFEVSESEGLEVRQMQSRSLREDLAPIFDRMLRRRKKAGTAVISAVGVPEVSQALELLHMGPKQREDQLKITEFLNEVNEFGFTPLTLDFEAFVRFIRQVKEWQATCMRAEDRAYGVELGLQERMVDEFRVIFDIIDNTGSGELDLLGVKRACGLLGQKSLSFEELRKIFEQLDKDGSGAIDFREFLHMTNMANLGKQKGRSNPLG
ncbi:unnamed protein product, partial [Cladocopium goreaui]